jgi:hypothetical protein
VFVFESGVGDAASQVETRFRGKCVAKEESGPEKFLRNLAGLRLTPPGFRRARERPESSVITYF